MSNCFDLTTPEEQIRINEDNIEKLKKTSETADKALQLAQNANTAAQSALTTSTKLNDSYLTEFHVIETIRKTITPSEVIDLSYTVENENFYLTDSLISFSVLGESLNLYNAKESEIFLKEQTEEGKITFGFSKKPSGDIIIDILVLLLGTKSLGGE